MRWTWIGDPGRRRRRRKGKVKHRHALATAARTEPLPAPSTHLGFRKSPSSRRAGSVQQGRRNVLKIKELWRLIFETSNNIASWKFVAIDLVLIQTFKKYTLLISLSRCFICKIDESPLYCYNPLVTLYGRSVRRHVQISITLQPIQCPHFIYVLA